MSRILFGDSATGSIIAQIQQALNASGFSTQGTDGWYGTNTHNAMANYQASKGSLTTGLLDDATWPGLVQAPIPGVFQRCLQLTAAFEGHGFGLAQGNFDGALLTWGIIGFTVAAGEVQDIVLTVNSAHPDIVQAAFGSYAGELVNIMQASAADQTSWANTHTLPNGTLAEPWKTMFASFGSYPEVQAEQMNHVQNDYMIPAIGTARSLGFTSELGMALSFDIHVQDGGIKNTAMQQIQQNSAHGMSEDALRVVVANAVADWASPSWVADVRARKLAIATGSGIVHGHNFIMENCGISGDYPAPQLQ